MSKKISVKVVSSTSPSPYPVSKALRHPVKRVMLINPPGKFTVTQQGSRERKLAVPPMGLAYLGAQLLKAGYIVDVLDVLIEAYANETAAEGSVFYGLSEAQIRKRIKDFNPDMIGVSCLFSNRGREALRLCEIAKETIPDAHVIMGGQHPSGCPELVKMPYIDYMMWGEADHSLIELLDTINNDGDLAQVSQIILKTEDGGYWKSPQLSLPGVKDLPLPAWHLIRLADYWKVGLADYEVSDQEVKRFMVMISSRGCPHDCFFCTAPMMTERRYRQRTLEDVFAEIRKYREEYGTEEIHFWDDNFFINTKRTKELLRGLVETFPGMTFQVPSGSEVNAIDDEVIELMARAGFKKLFLAIESANEEIQESYVDKKVKLGRVKDIVSKLKDVNIISEGSFMVGFPHETKAQVDATFRKATEFGFDRISISIVNPLPGTDLYDMCVKEELLHEGFDPQNIRWSMESIKLEGVERGYLERRRREVWLEYMKDRIDIEKYENQNIQRSSKNTGDE